MAVKRDITLRRRHRAIVKAKGEPCHLCHQPIDYSVASPHPESFTIDHIVPLAQGGKDQLANIAPAHRRCNLAKNKRDLRVVGSREI